MLTPGHRRHSLTLLLRGETNIIIRFRNTGNSVDMCIRKSGTQVACYGNAIEHDWRTTGVCTIQTLATTDTISLYLESGGANDCIEDTSFNYNRISIHLIYQT